MNYNSLVIQEKQNKQKYIYEELNYKIEFFPPYNRHQNCLDKSLPRSILQLSVTT